MAGRISRTIELFMAIYFVSRALDMLLNAITDVRNKIVETSHA